MRRAYAAGNRALLEQEVEVLRIAVSGEIPAHLALESLWPAAKVRRFRHEKSVEVENRELVFSCSCSTYIILHTTHQE